MSEKTALARVILIIVITWILSLVTTLAIVYVAPSIFPISVSTDNIVDEAIITSKLADGTVTSAKILDGTLTAEDIADGSVISVKVANGAVTTTKIKDGAVSTDKLANEAVTADKLGNESVTTDKLANEAVKTDNIANSSVVTIKLADGSITSAKILDGTVTAVDLANGSIITSKIANGAVTTEKIADSAITEDKIADGNVTNIKLEAGAIPYNVSTASGYDTTSSTGFVDMNGMSVNLNLTRNSTLIIMCSAQAHLSASGNYIYWIAMVNTTQANPVSDYIIITPSTDYGSYSYTFYMPDVAAGFYTVKIQWRVWLGTSTGYVDERTLTVIALPE